MCQFSRSTHGVRIRLTHKSMPLETFANKYQIITIYHIFNKSFLDCREFCAYNGTKKLARGASPPDKSGCLKVQREIVSAGDIVSDLITLTEAATRLRLSRNTVYKLCRAKELPARKVGHQWRIRVADLQRWLSAHQEVVQSRPKATGDPLLS